MRADRIGPSRTDCYILTETNTEKILRYTKELAPDFVVIDSIQTLSSPHLESTPGSISQVRESAGEMQRFAKETGIPVFLIGHINKEGAIAGRNCWSTLSIQYCSLKAIVIIPIGSYAP
jgi:DNA repair protein RadA/Sms